MKQIIYSVFLLTILSSGLSCSKPGSPKPTPIVNISPCTVMTAPSYFGTSQTFTYDGNNHMTKLSYEFGYPGYTTFTKTVDGTKTFSSYTNKGNVIEETDVFVGGTKNLYDGQPEMLVKTEHQKYTDGRADLYLAPDTILSFHYDSKKRLDTLIYHHFMITSSPSYTYSRQLMNTFIAFTYDDNDNVIKLQQTEVIRFGSYVVNNPSQSYFLYEYNNQTIINMTYDDKPSPYSAILKYWIFVQADWGVAINRNFSAIIAALSKHNPLTMSYELLDGKPNQTRNGMSYNYNAQGFPADNYTYNCK